MIRLGVTGTDTGVGKTVVTCAAAAALRARGLRVVAMKPIETGVAFDDPLRDGARIARAAKNEMPLSVTAPVVFDRPLSPLFAARAANTVIDLTALDVAVRDADRDADALIVEGAGGLLVPITAVVSFADLFRRWSLDLIVVAANRLGVVNHTMLTVHAARSAGLSVRAIVLTCSTAPGDAVADPSTSTNAEQLRELLSRRTSPPRGTSAKSAAASGPTVVVELPWIQRVDDLPTLAHYAELSGLADVAARGAPVKPGDSPPTS
ncbi:MAG TPA: dethiobiotin synthase [Gemmatimonadaceae bacterium]|jgi:dethiobiotin synthetase|nr:dethiobiotin synthase [Gemmatimonadaceae bacterium]